MVMVRKWYSIKNTVTTINTSVSKVTKQLTGAITLLNTIRGAESTDLNDCQKDYIIKLGIFSYLCRPCTVCWQPLLLLLLFYAKF